MADWLYPSLVRYLTKRFVRDRIPALLDQQQLELLVRREVARHVFDSDELTRDYQQTRDIHRQLPHSIDRMVPKDSADKGADASAVDGTRRQREEAAASAREAVWQQIALEVFSDQAIKNDETETAACISYHKHASHPARLTRRINRHVPAMVTGCLIIAALAIFSGSFTGNAASIPPAMPQPVVAVVMATAGPPSLSADRISASRGTDSADGDRPADRVMRLLPAWSTPPIQQAVAFGITADTVPVLGDDELAVPTPPDIDTPSGYTSDET